MTTILLVEDDPISLELVSAMCAAAGHEVDAVADGFSALRKLRERTYAVAIVDYHLPEMDGFALARLMREMSRGLHLIGVTADRHGLASRRGADALFDAILTKPLAAGPLLTALTPPPASTSPPDEARPLSAREAAAALLAAPGPDRARDAAAAFWRARGLDASPRAVACPPASGEQRGVLEHCFTLVEDRDGADLVLLLDRGGAEAIPRSGGPAVPAIPVVAVSHHLAGMADLVFRVDDPASWSEIASLVRSRRGRHPDGAVRAGQGGSARPVPAPPGGKRAYLDEFTSTPPLDAPDRRGVPVAAGPDAGLLDAPSAHPAEGRARPTSPLRILLVGGTSPSLQQLRGELSRGGHRVTSTDVVARDILRSLATAYDLILAELDGLSGQEAAVLREVGTELRTTTTVALFGLAAEEDHAMEEPGMEAALSRRLVWPCRPATILAEIESWAAARPEPGPGAPRAEARPVDLDLYDELARLVGRERLQALTRALFAQIDRCVADAQLPTADRDQLARDAHRLLAAAGTLGLPEISDLARALASVAVARQDIDPALTRLRAGRRAAQRALVASGKLARPEAAA